MRLTGEDAPIVVNVLTGFLGSGKTTLLRQILAEEAYGDTAVLINELGEVGLDHMLVAEIAPDVVLLNSGCLCCTLRGELRDALADLLNKRLDGSIPPFKRVIVETTGLAKPALILSTVFADPLIRHHFTIGTVLATVDCMHSTLAKDSSTAPPEEWLEQIAAADVLVLTKTDLVNEQRVQEVSRLLQSLNATAVQHLVHDLHVATLFTSRFSASTIGQSTPFPIPHKAGRFSSLLAQQENEQAAAPSAPSYTPYFDHDISTQTLHISEVQPLDWEAFGVWLSMLLHAHGKQILRIKGIVHIEGNADPVVIQGVGHVIYPPEHLQGWASMPPRTDLVFITRHLPVQQIKKSFNVFVLKHTDPQ